APVSAFSMQEGCVEVRVLPSRSGKPCVVQLEPPTSFLQVQNTCVTGRGLPFITRARNTNTIIVTVENPIHYFASVANETFVRNGIRINGNVIVTPRDARTDWRQVSEHSTPLNVLVYVINKKSQNHY